MSDLDKQYYIEHEDIETPENGTAYFGPFGADEIVDRCNDTYADLLAGSGNVDSVLLTDAEAEAIGYINPRTYWMEQLALAEDDSGPAIRVFEVGRKP